MKHQSGEGEKRKNDRGERVSGFERARFADFKPDLLTDEEIDPADFFDPEEFGYRRDLKSFRS